VNKEVIFAKLEGLTNIPTLPVIVQALGKAVRDPNSDAAQSETLVAIMQGSK
jgi:HD-like signal output (HDOD) protein